MMERLALLVEGDAVDVRHLPLEVPRGETARPPVAAGGLPLREMERQAIERVLHEEGWHHGRAAARLGLPIRTLYRKIKTYSLSRPHRGGPHPGSGRTA
jgi:DNA-binding NtrC family response regulator